MIVVDGIARDFTVPPPANDQSRKFDLLGSSFDNLGNGIHAEAPFSFWDKGDGSVVDARQMRRASSIGLNETIEFANKHATHYVLSAANFLLFEDLSESRRESYRSLQASLERLEIPLVVLGLGAQAPRRWNPTDHQLPVEAVELMKFLGEKCEQISLRGKFTASIFRDYAGVRNTVVTGCPSFFQFPESFSNLRAFLASRRDGNIAYNVTNFRKPAEQELMKQAIKSGHYWMGVQEDEVHSFAIEVNRNFELANIPDKMHFLFQQRSDGLTRNDVANYYIRRYRKFSSTAEWTKFNRDQIRFSYGTRFHGNMSALISGKPALWIVHDSRTQEMVDALNLPRITLSEAIESPIESRERSVDYDMLFDNLRPMYNVFNSFLDTSGLPKIQLKF